MQLSVANQLLRGISDETYRTLLATQTWPWVKKTIFGFLVLLTMIGLDPETFWMRWRIDEEHEINF